MNINGGDHPRNDRQISVISQRAFAGFHNNPKIVSPALIGIGLGCDIHNPTLQTAISNEVIGADFRHRALPDFHMADISRIQPRISARSASLNAPVVTSSRPEPPSRERIDMQSK